MIAIELVKNPPEAQVIWNKLTPNITIYDTWEFRYCFYKYENSELFFYTAYENGEPI